MTKTQKMYEANAVLNDAIRKLEASQAMFSVATGHDCEEVNRFLKASIMLAKDGEALMHQRIKSGTKKH